jgi:hypothetical protein
LKSPQQIKTFYGPQTDTFGFIAVKGAILYIVFRGTISVENWKSNVKTLTNRQYELCFREITHQLSNSVIEFLEGLKDQNFEIYIQGHSLGGGLATLCLPWLLQTFGTIVPLPEINNSTGQNILWKLRKQCHIKFITFGSALSVTYDEKQRFEDKAKHFKIRSYHFRNEHDPVPFLQSKQYTRLDTNFVIKSKEPWTIQKGIKYMLVPPILLGAELVLKNHSPEEYLKRLQSLLDTRLPILNNERSCQISDAYSDVDLESDSEMDYVDYLRNILLQSMDSFRLNGIEVFESVLHAGVLEASKRYHSDESCILVFQGRPSNVTICYDVIETNLWGFSGYILTKIKPLDISLLENIISKVKHEKKVERITATLTTVLEGGRDVSFVCVPKTHKPILAGNLKPIVLELDHFTLVLF